MQNFNEELFLRDRRTKVIYFDINGHVWHLSGFGQGREGATLGVEPDNLYMIDTELLWTEGARQDGSSYEGTVISRREIDFEVQIKSSTVRGFHAINDKWWRGWSARTPGTLAFYTREMGWRWTRVRLAGNVEPKWGKDPALIRACDYDMTIAADDAMFRSAMEFGYWRNVGGTGQGSILLKNTADHIAFPEYVMPGPGTYSIQDGPDGDMIPLTPIRAGQTLKLKTHREKLSLRLYDSTTGIDGRTAWRGWGTKRFENHLEPHSINRIKVSVTGGTPNSQVMAQVFPRHYRPF
ncbi:minor tail protein [Gordonia phage Lozinak]|nr:minor tail protein [Gordonia phage ClubL]YP_009276160.1 minor tail protein [Gordonia phage Bachita]YP_009281203.1 minor tail protein [Gordonia phage Cucurbita]ATN90673.1 minor tail protein [Gordonia phage Lozinak]AUE23616.1 minor tail protein [Gordonia phage Toniann]QAU06912.1 minor tail protein [Gordonia phage Aphelion]QKY79624.1 minor tail protein [Gordonia Phage Engineer]WKW85846.1 minor tail protein [Gordonia Phage PhinkBoden]